MSPRSNLDLDTILKKASEMADIEGIDSISMASLAKSLNVKSPSLYNHISGMQELRIELAKCAMELLYTVLVNSTIGKAGDNAIRSLSKAYITFARQHPGLYEAMIQVPNPKDIKLKEPSDKIVNLIFAVLDFYKLQKIDEIHITRGLRSMIHGFASLESTGGFGMPIELDKSLDLMIDVFISGIHSMTKSLPSEC